MLFLVFLPTNYHPCLPSALLASSLPSHRTRGRPQQTQTEVNMAPEVVDREKAQENARTARQRDQCGQRQWGPDGGPIRNRTDGSAGGGKTLFALSLNQRRAELCAFVCGKEVLVWFYVCICVSKLTFTVDYGILCMKTFCCDFHAN